MKKNLVLVAALAVVAAVIAGYFIRFSRGPAAPVAANPPVADAPRVPIGKSGGDTAPAAIFPARVPAAQSAKTFVIYTDSGFSPALLAVKTGTTVFFKNESSGGFWPASNNHPTHTVYPGSGISKCGTSEESGIFDACRGIASGGSWQFKFDIAGDWKYHDHLNPGNTGKVTVER